MKKAQRLHREPDPRVRRVLGVALATSALLVAGALTVVGVRLEQVHLAYRLDALRGDRTRAAETIRQLEIEVATLRSPSRLEARARQIGLVAPGRDQVRLAREYVSAGTGLAAERNRAGGAGRSVKDAAVRTRVLLLAAVLAVVFGGLTGRLAWLMIIKHGDLAQIAERQYSRTVVLRAQRGPIVDRQGAPLATSTATESLFVQPRSVGDPVRVAARVAPLVGVPEAEVHAALTGSRSFVWLRRKLPPAVTDRVKALREPGLGFLPEPLRLSIPTASWRRTSSASRAPRAGSRASSGLGTRSSPACRARRSWVAMRSAARSRRRTRSRPRSRARGSC